MQQIGSKVHQRGRWLSLMHQQPSIDSSLTPLSADDLQQTQLIDFSIDNFPFFFRWIISVHLTWKNCVVNMLLAPSAAEICSFESQMDRLVSPLFFCDNVLNTFELKFEFQGLILNPQKNRWIYWIFSDFSIFFRIFGIFFGVRKFYR